MDWPDDFTWGTTLSSLDEGHVAAAVESGLGHVRIGIDWAGVQPAAGNVDEGALETYRVALEAARSLGATPWLGLLDGPGPGWFVDDEGGFARDGRRGRYLFSTYVDVVADTLGDLAGGWIPLTAPTTRIHHDLMPRLGPHDRTPERADAVLRTVLAAAADAAGLLRGEVPVATEHAIRPVYRHAETAEATAAFRRQEWLRWESWNTPGFLDPFDLLGFRYAGAIGIDADGRPEAHPANAPRVTDTVTAWPEGIAHAVRRLAHDQPLPLLVLELGIPTDDESLRTGHVEDCLGFVAEAIGDGVDIRGCLLGGAIDAGGEPRPVVDAVRRLADG